jgi:hypothetical protein
MTFAAGDDPAVKHVEASLRQQDVGGLAGDVDGARHRDPDIGGVQRRGIIDAVADEADHVTAALQGEQDARLLSG